jgi:hypothetical protein
MKKSKFINLVAGKTLLTASHVALSGQTCPDPNSKSQSVENTAIDAEITAPDSFTNLQNDFYVVGSDLSSLKVRVSGLERCGQAVDIYLVYSVDLASPNDWPRTQVGKIFLGKNLEIFDISLNVPSRDQLDFTLDLNQVREKFPNKQLVFIQVATFPSGDLNFEKAQISNLINLALYSRRVCQGEGKTKPVIPCL